MSASGAERRKRHRAKVEAGLLPGRRRSHYTTEQIAAAVRQDLGEMRTQLDHTRHAKTDPNWHFDLDTAAAHKRQRRIVRPSRAQEVAQLAGIIP